MNQEQDKENIRKRQKRKKIAEEMPCKIEDEKEYLLIVGARIKQVLTFYDIGIRSVARTTGFHFSKISRMLDGNAIVDIFFLKKFTEAYNVSLVWLVLGHGLAFSSGKESVAIELENETLRAEVKQLRATIDTFNNVLKPKNA